MSRETQAEIFMETLAEMLAEDRADKSARLLRHARAKADSYLTRSFGEYTNEHQTPRRLADETSAAWTT